MFIVSSAQNIDRWSRSTVRASGPAEHLSPISTPQLWPTPRAETRSPSRAFPTSRSTSPTDQRVLVKESGQFDRLDLIQGRVCVFPEWLAEHAGEVTLLLPSSAIRGGSQGRRSRRTGVVSLVAVAGLPEGTQW